MGWMDGERERGERGEGESSFHCVLHPNQIRETRKQSAREGGRRCASLERGACARRRGWKGRDARGVVEESGTAPRAPRAFRHSLSGRHAPAAHTERRPCTPAVPPSPTHNMRPTGLPRRAAVLAALLVLTLVLAHPALAAPWDPVLDAAAAAVGVDHHTEPLDKADTDLDEPPGDAKPPPHPLGDKATIAQRIDAALTHEFEGDAAAAAAAEGATFSETSKSEDVS
jgi:hypothetical protein